MLGTNVNIQFCNLITNLAGSVKPIWLQQTRRMLDNNRFEVIANDMKSVK